MSATAILSVGMFTIQAIADDAVEAIVFVADQAIANNADDIVESTNLRNLSFSLGTDVTTAYFFRGYLQEDQGFIFQPWVELGVTLIEGVDNSPGVSLTFGNWNSFHSKKTGATESNVRSWYESDLYGGITLDWDAFSLGASYTVYAYPNSDTDTVQEIGVSAGFSLPDDTIVNTVLGDISFGVYFEVDNSNVAADEAIYAELGFGPSFDIFDEKATLSIPVTLGFSIDDYYDDPSGNDDFFGYASCGADVSIPLGSGSYGDWTLKLGGNLLFLGSAAEAANRGDDFEVVGYIGMSFSF